jgi:hypothetical protein
MNKEWNAHENKAMIMLSTYEDEGEQCWSTRGEIITCRRVPGKNTYLAVYCSGGKYPYLFSAKKYGLVAGTLAATTTAAAHKCCDQVSFFLTGLRYPHVYSFRSLLKQLEPNTLLVFGLALTGKRTRKMVNPSSYTRTHTHTHTLIHIYTHTHIHKHTHTHTHTYSTRAPKATCS